MKIHVKALSVLLTSFVMLLSSCEREESAGQISGGGVEISATESNYVNIAPSNRAAVMKINIEDALIEDKPFTSYSFEFSNFKDKYIITAELNANHTEIVLNIEDNQFDFTTLNIKAPDKYMINIPQSQATANQVCTVIKNTVNDTPFPEILKFDFYLSDFSDESLPYKVSRFYAVKDNRLTPITLVDGDSGIRFANQYTGDTSLYHTEVDKFMPEPVVYTDENERLNADIYTYTFDPEAMVMIKNKVDIKTADPIYYGYACHAAADDIYRYFTSTGLNVDSSGEYIEVETPNNDISEYYFAVDDERFTGLESLREFVSGYFSPRIVDMMFLNAPQKYRDFNGSLYTIAGDYAVNKSLGKLTITGYVENEDGYTFTTKQETLDDYGNVTDYIDGGDFTVVSEGRGSDFIITRYRYPYS